MSLSSRFTHPFERWMNNIVRRELDSWRGPGKLKGNAKSMNKMSLRPMNEWAVGAPMMSPWNSRWMEPWMNFEEPWYAEAPWAGEHGLQSWMQSHAMENEKGQLELRTKMPQGIEKGDIHLDFEEGGLRMTATKSHQHSRKLQHGQGSSMHKSHVSVSHYWPLEKGITEKDIEANFLEDQGVLEITVNQAHKLPESRNKALPISIGSSSTKTPHQMLDQPPTASQIIDQVSAKKSDAPITLNARPTRSEPTQELPTLKELASDAKDATFEAAKGAGTKFKEFASDIADTTKAAASKVSSTAKPMKDTTAKKPVVGPDAPQMPSMDEM